MLLSNNNLLDTRIETSPANKILKGRPDYFKLMGNLPENNQPLYLMMNLETSCSYRCPKCALEGERKEHRKDALTLDQRIRVMREAAKLGVKTLAIAGLGEPTENFSLIGPVIAEANKLGLVTILFSTLNKLTREMAEFFRDQNVSVIASVDSLRPKLYRKLTGTGDLANILEKMKILREVYQQENFSLSGNNIVRLGINTTLTEDNRDEIDEIKAFCGDDLQFICNPPMKRGTFNHDLLWKKLVGNSLSDLQKQAREKSDTKGNSTFTESSCGYFIRGLSVDTDGEMMTCTYAGESVDILQKNVLELIESGELIKHYLMIREKFKAHGEKLGYIPACPVRDESFNEFLIKLRRK